MGAVRRRDDACVQEVGDMLVLLNALQAGNASGAGRYTAHLAQSLTALGGDVNIAVIWPEGVARDVADDASYIESTAVGVAKRVFFDQVGIKQVRSRLGADVVHYPANVGALTRIPNTVLTVHDLSFLREPKWFPAGRSFYYRKAVLRSAGLAARIVADSRATADDLVSMAGVAASKIDVVHLGVDEGFRPASEEAQASVRKTYNLPQGNFFLYCGTLEPRKNLPRVIEAWSSIAERCDWDLVIAGRRGWGVDAIEQAIAESAHADRIHPPGFIEQGDLPAVMTAAGAFVWPSLWEGFGLPPLEAMACGTPVVTSSTSSLPEVVGDAAVLVDPHDVAAIAEGMLAVAEGAALRADLSAKGLERAAGFTWKKTAEETVETYRKVLQA